MGLNNNLMKAIVNQARSNPKRVVFADADHFKILKAVEIIKEEGIAIPVLLGNKERIREITEQNHLDIEGIEIIDPRDPAEHDRVLRYGELMFKKLQRRGFSFYEAAKAMWESNYFGSMMVETGEADALITGLTRKHKESVLPPMMILGTEENSKVAGLHIFLTRGGPVFMSDIAMNINPTAEELVEITALTARTVRMFNIEPHIALLSYSNFGSLKGDEPTKIKRALSLLKEQYPELIVDGEVQADIAFEQQELENHFPFSPLVKEKVNTLIFPNLSSGNIAYKLMQVLGTSDSIGPLLQGMKKSVQVLQLGCSVRDIVNIVAFAGCDAEIKSGNKN